MSDNQPQNHRPYPPQDPYGRPGAYDPHGTYEGYEGYDRQAAPAPQQAAPRQPAPYDPQTGYGAPYGQQGYGAAAQQPHQHPQQHQQHNPYGQGQYGYDAYGQQQPQEQRPQQPYQAPQPPQAQHHQPQPHQHQPQAPQQPHYGPLPTQHQSPQPAEEPYARRHPEAAPAAPAPAVPTLPTAPLAPNQRARAEGRSPIIPPGIQPAALTAVLALLLALTGPLARPVLAVPVALLQAVTAAGWFRLNGMWPARQGIALAFLAGLATDVALLFTDRDSAPLVGIGTLGVWCLFVLVLQLRNRSSADERMYALTAGLTSTALAVLAGGQLAASPHAVVVGAAAVGVATLARALPLPAPVSIGVALVAAAGAGVGAGQLTGLGTSGALLGLAAGGCALIGLRVASYDYPSRFVHMTAGVALPLALAAPAVYVLGRALG
ncbi:hypothetical protein [Streptomyces lydicus]|uniref:hypothetical protein n=1 Tax=Streptomyces lydicus TaxID=47763 RepID=UPI0005252C90|nr:hypothetical protein [Streptomyces lydicus]UEG93089.1 hypothetical protein LJ741_22570 [Streptomyces lydicus]